MKNLMFIVVGILFGGTALAQDRNAGNARRMDELIVALSSTEFIKEYKDYRSKVEAKVMELKIETSLDPKEVAKAKIAYRQSQQKFDDIFEQLKRDLSTSAGRKLLKKSPHQFAENYQTQLDEAKTYCNNNFVLKADMLLKKDAVDPILIAMAIKSLIGLFKTYMDNKAADEAFNIAYLETKLIEPLKFKPWEKITVD